jgi:hypothetical protein
MSRDAKVQWAAGGLMALALAASMGLSVQMTSIAGKAKLTYTDRAEDNDRWEISLGVAMGAFRGIFVNALWMRANDMKEAGKYYEAVELARAITRLQPRFPRVWVFHAWNLAYNISVMTKTREERWDWVNQGIRILRDEGIQANPNDLLLHKELAWIYAHKIQGFTDDANNYYKRQVAREWTVVMGPPPRRDSDDRVRSKAIAKYVAWLTTIAEAPKSLEAIYAAHPQAPALIAKLQSELNWNLENPLDRFAMLERVEINRAYETSARKEVFFARMAGPRTNALRVLMNDPQYKDVWEPLVLHVRNRVLTQDFHMEVDRMIRYTDKYGPLDWRHPSTHALYWSARGVEEAGDRVRDDKKNQQDFDFLNTDRIVVQSLQELFRTGDIFFDFRASIFQQYPMYQVMPSAHFAESYGMVLDEIRSRAWAWDPSRGEVIKLEDQTAERGVSHLSDGYQNFLIDVVLFMYRRGDMQSAGEWYSKLRNFKKQNVYDPDRVARFSVPINEFVQTELNDQATRPSTTISQVQGAIFNAYAAGLLGQDPDVFLSQMNYARDFHRYFMNEQARRTSVDRETYRMEQLDRDFNVVAGNTFVFFIQSLDLDDANSSYIAAPPSLQAWAYDILREKYFDEIAAARQIAASGKTFDQLFPEPPEADLKAARDHIVEMMTQREKQQNNERQ